MTQPIPQGEIPKEPIKPIDSVEPPASNVQLPASEQPEEFDKERAMNTIKNLREVEKQAKKERAELEQLRAKEQQRADAELSEAQRLQKQNEELQNKYATLQADLWRNEAATAANLPSIFAERIQGKTKEEMLEDAKKLADALPKVEQKKQAPPINATNPANASQAETAAQQRERLFGKQGNIFDLQAIRDAGGGQWVADSDNKS